MKKITAIVVDDSAVVRGLITKGLQANPHIEVITTAFNGEVGVTYYKKYNPDIVIMDIEMPVMDGIEALKQILDYDPGAKVIVCSTLSTKNAEVTMHALELGAADCVAKPTASQEMDASAFQTGLIQRVLSFAGYMGNDLIEAMQETAIDLNPRIKSNEVVTTRAREKTDQTDDKKQTQTPPKSTAPSVAIKEPIAALPVMKEKIVLRPMPETKPRYKVIAIGSSTGGPQALFRVLNDLKEASLPIVITQHMPPTFTSMLAQHINRNTPFHAQEAEDGMILENGEIYVAPGGKHMAFEKDKMQIKITLNDGPAENFCKPAVDVMFRSLVKLFGGNILGVILTGMGYDGARSSQLLVDHGGVLIAQDEATSVVWGMPGAVAKAGLCHAILPVEKIGNKMNAFLGS